MALEPIIDALAFVVQQVPPTAQVHTYDRISIEPEDVEEVLGMLDGNFSKGWSVRAWLWDRRSSEETWATNAENVRRHTLRLQGFWEVHDKSASRKAFRLATEAICTALRRWAYVGPDILIPGLPSGIQDDLPEIELLGPPQVEADGFTIVGETYLCHSVQVTVVVQERLFHVP